MNIITSKSNNVIKNAKKLHQKKYRTDSYLIEGWHLFEEALENQAIIRQVFVLEAYLDRVENIQNVTVVTSEILSLLADSKTPQGIVAEIALEKPELPDQLHGRYLYLEDVQDPGNVGTMIRTADAAGFDGVMISKHPQISLVSRLFDPCREVISIFLSGKWTEKNCLNELVNPI